MKTIFKPENGNQKYILYMAQIQWQQEADSLQLFGTNEQNKKLCQFFYFPRNRKHYFPHIHEATNFWEKEYKQMSMKSTFFNKSSERVLL